ncbi:hypothetical protein [Actinophytocola sp.]|uniref:hypothetical protein n=1 Tax=Actinophytocola sp. TaxID=1872138 RepID=UPI003D6A3C20
MAGVPMPELPPGPACDLITALHKLYENAGRPSLRDVSKWIEDDDDLPATASHEQVRQVLLGKLTTWQRTKAFVHVLVRESTPPGDLDATLLEFKELWLAADNTRKEVRASPKLDIAVRWLYGDGPREAVKIVLRTTLLVPLAGEGGFVLAETRALGRWLCVFTSSARLTEHQAATEPAWSATWTPMGGRQLFERLHAVAGDASILVDGWTEKNALPITAEIIATTIR